MKNIYEGGKNIHEPKTLEEEGADLEIRIAELDHLIKEKIPNQATIETLKKSLIEYQARLEEIKSKKFDVAA